MHAHKLCGCVVSCTLDGEERRSERDHEPRVAYCPLHASAPDLLAALERILASHDLTCAGQECSITGVDAARFAIRKAKGE